MGVHGQPNTTNPRRVAFAKLEREYVALRASGVPSRTAALDLGLAPKTREIFENSYWTQTNPRAAYAKDGSCPRFAHHGPHIAAVVAEGGFIHRRIEDERTLTINWRGEVVAA